MRSTIYLALMGLIAAAGMVVGTSSASAVVPSAPSSCKASYTADNEVLVEWTHDATDLTRFHIREYGVKEPLEVPGDARSVIWPRPLLTNDPQFAIRAFNADGYGAMCLTGSIQPYSGSEPTPTPDPEPEPEPTPTDPEPEPEPEPDPNPPVTNTDLPYTADSFFKSRVDVAGVPINEQRTQEFHQEMATHPDQGGKGIDWPKINVNENWAMSYDVSDANDPVWTLSGGNTGHEKLVHLTTSGFHMADSVADTFPDGNQDRPGVIIDTANGFTVQFADAVPNKATRTINVSNAAVFYHDSNGLDYRNPQSNDQRNFSSRGRIPDAMIVRRDTLDQAVQNGTGLGHVLHLFFVETNTADGFVHPMVGAESQKAGFGAEGERIRLKPSVDLEARGLTGHALALARTFQEHGAYLGDNSGSATQIKASQPQHYVGTNITTDAFKGKLFWTDFEVVEQGWQ